MPRLPRVRPSELQPLPPETRTVGQLVAEAIRFYGARFWPCLALGVPVAGLNQISFELSDAVEDLSSTAKILIALATTSVLGAVLLTASYAAACALVGGVRLRARRTLTALAAGVLVWVPAPFLLLVFVLPGVAWLALAGLVVPVVVLERGGLRSAFRRALELARADYVHALGSLATVVILYALTRAMLAILLHGAGDQAERVAGFLADVVLSPLLFLGAALLYFDQAARRQAALAGVEAGVAGAGGER